MTDVYATLSDFLFTERTAQTDFLRTLVQTPSDNPKGDCAPLAERTRELLLALGLEVQAYPVPQPMVDACGMISATNLIVRKTFGAGTGPVIALNAHGDVVPPGLGWQHDPYGGEVEHDPVHGEVMYGRGVAVSKSDFATYTWALLALLDAQRTAASPLNGTVELHFTYDEETGGEIGPKYLLDQGLSTPDYAISAGFSYGITSAHNGCLHVEVSVKGKQAHAAMPHTGVDAIEASTLILRSLYDFRDALATRHSCTPGIDTPGLNIGLIQGGINTNVVPDHVVFRVDRRMIPEETGHDAEGELRALIKAAAAQRPGITVEVRRIMLAHPLSELDGVQPLIDVLQKHAATVFQTDIAVHGVPLYTDARHYTQAGVPTVLYGAGPRTLMEARGHNTDENLRLNDLYRATRVVACTLAELLAR